MWTTEQAPVDTRGEEIVKDPVRYFALAREAARRNIRTSAWERLTRALGRPDRVGH